MKNIAHEIEKFIFEKASETKLPSVSVTVMKDEDIIFNKAYGFADIEKNIPATTQTYYGIGSISKSFTCLAILKLQERGDLNIDDEVSKYIDFPLKNVTIRDLMSHTSGIPGLGYAEATIRSFVGDYSSWIPVAKADDLNGFLSKINQWKVFERGKRWFYLNEGYEILENIVETVSNEDYKSFLRKYIFEPANLNCKFLDELNEISNPQLKASPYFLFKNKLTKTNVPGGAIYGAGGIACSSEILARYGKFLIQKGNGVISKESIEEMEKPHIDLPHKLNYAKFYYGLGLMILDGLFNRTVYEHGGSVLVYTAHLLYSREDNISIAILSNSSGYPLKNISLYIYAKLIGENPEKFPFIHQERIYKKLKGVYYTYMNTIKLEVIPSGSFLKLKMHEDYFDQEIILIPEELSEENAKFYTLINGTKLPVEFFKEGKDMYLIYERYLFKKKCF